MPYDLLRFRPCSHNAIDELQGTTFEPGDEPEGLTGYLRTVSGGCDKCSGFTKAGDVELGAPESGGTRVLNALVPSGRGGSLSDTQPDDSVTFDIANDACAGCAGGL